MSAADNAELHIDPSVDLSNTILEHGRQEVEEDNDWVIVKKQRVIIWIPPQSPENLQNKDAEAASTKSKARKAVRQLSGMPKRTRKLPKETNDIPTACELKQTEGEVEKPPVAHSEDEARNGSVRMKDQAQALAIISPHENGTKDNSQDHLSLKPSVKQMLSSQRNGSVRMKDQAQALAIISPHENGTKDNSQDHLSQKPSVKQMLSSQRNAMVHGQQGTIRSSEQRIITHKLPLATSNVAMQKLRALNLERKLKVLGGLRNWLVLHGLSRFAHIFEREKLGMYQLVNLTMDKLKDMGADAVGPRRMLLCAIDHMCQPYIL